MTRPRPFANAVVLGVCAVCALSILTRFPRWIRGPDEAYVVVAEDAWAGRLGLHNYDEHAMAERTGAMSDGRNRNFLAPTPPSIAVLLLPLAWLPQSARPIVWLVLNVAAVVMTCWLVGRVVSWPARHPALATTAAAAVLFSEPLAENLARGQVYLLLMPATAALLVAQPQDDQGGSGARDLHDRKAVGRCRVACIGRCEAVASAGHRGDADGCIDGGRGLRRWARRGGTIFVSCCRSGLPRQK